MSVPFKFPLILSAIAFVAVLVTCLLVFNKLSSVGINCTNIIGDGYAMGLDKEPVVIGQSCESNTQDYATTRVAVAVSLGIAVIMWGIVRISTQKSITVAKKVSMLLLILVFSVVLFFAIAFTTSILGGVFYTSKNDMDLSVLLLTIYFIVSLVISYFAVNHFFKSKKHV